MLKPARVKLTIYGGFTFDRTWQRTAPDPDDPETQVPVDLSGWTARAEGRRKATAEDLDFAFDTTPASGEGIITLDAQGHIRLYMTDDATGDLDFREGEWDLKLTNPGGDSEKFFVGPTEYIPAVTHGE